MTSDVRVCVDLVPVEPGGLNGGAKIVAITVVNGLAEGGYRLTCFCRDQAFADLREQLAAAVDLRPIVDEQGLSAAVVDAEAQHGGPFEILFFPFTDVSFLRPPARIISIIHDLQFFDQPENFSPAEYAERELSIRHSITRADVVITISKFVEGRSPNDIQRQQRKYG